MMKMEKSSESMFNTDARAEDSKVPAKEIGREFVRHYYTMLSEKPNEAGRFYSHESYFMHNDMPEVCGTESIQKAIQQLNFQDCKARIYSISGTNTVNNGLVLQVCGELALKGSAKRRFCQTFVLYPQSPKKFYVHDDVFQWLDKAFGDPIPQQKVETEESDVAFTNEQQLNGHKPASLGENITIDSPNDVAAEPDRLDIHQNEKHLEDYVAPVSPGVVEEVTKKQELPAVAEIETKVQETGPKSWAKMVSSGTAGKPVTQNTSYQNATQLPPAPPRQPHPPPTNKPSNVVPENRRRDDRGHKQPSNRDRDRYQQRENGNRSRGVTQRSELTLFVSNIPRTDPISWEGLESELRGTFEKFGKVKEVSIPKTVKDPLVGKPDRIYVFVDMDSQDDIDSVFNNCRSDDHGRKYLEVNLPVVNYVGEVNVSNRKDDERNSGPHSRGFDNRGGSRGNFGGSGGARRGGGGGNQDGRGGGQRRGGGGHDHRDNNPK